MEGIPGQRDGVYWVEKSDDKKGQDAIWWLSSPLHILGETRDAEQSNWGRLLAWKDNDGHPHRWACPVEMLAASDTAEFRRELARGGLTITANGKARQKLVEYVLNHHPEATERLRCVSRIGWHDLRYVLPASVHGQQDGEGVIYQGADSGDFASAGTLEDWQQHIAAMAAGNSRIVFAISVAFAGVLADMAGESGGGFHYVGTTSKGKTSTLLDPAASVWGSPDRFAKKWRTTQNGLEALCLGRNDNLLILDELAQIAAADAGGAVGDQAARVGQAGFEQRDQAELGRRRVATWYGDQAGALDRLAIDLGQAIDRLRQQFRRTMRLAIPLGPLFGILQAEVGGQVNHLSAGRKQFAGQGMCHAMRGGEEHHVAGAEGGTVRHAEGQAVVVAPQVRVHIGHSQTGLGSGSDDYHLSLRMLSQQTQQFDTGVTRAADDTDLDHKPALNEPTGKLPMIRPLQSGANT